MSNARFISLDAKIKKLKEVVKDIDTNNLATYTFWNMFRFATMGEKIALQSPARQILYLFGIACATNEPNEPPKDIDGKFSQVEELLNDIFGKYMNVYLPTKEDLKNGLEDEWHRVREVAMPMFLGYFFESLKVTTDSFKDIITVYFNGFEKEIKDNFGIDHHQMIEIIDLIGDKIQNKHERHMEIMHVLKEEHSKLKDIEPENFHEFMEGIKERTKHFAAEMNDMMTGSVSFDFNSIRTTMGSDAVDSFIKTFTTERGKSNEIKYITDENPLSYKPLVTTNNKDFVVPSPNMLFEATLVNIEDFFKKSKHSEKYRKSRDTRLENETTNVFKNFFPESTTIIESVFETNTSHNEHDLIVIHNRTIIIVEAKASPRRAPLRDPARAYLRLRDDFKRKSGIQSAADQGNNLRRLIINNDTTPLYDKKGNLIITINRCDYDHIYCVCVTKDDFGMLATDLTLMLEKQDDEPYPWVICIQDLKFYIECLKDINLTHDYLLSYITERIKLHGKVIAADELEYAGAYLNYGNFNFISDNHHTKTFLDISESRVFDEIYLEKINGRVYTHQVKEPGYNELSREKLFSKLHKHPSHKDAKKSKAKRKEQKKSRKHNR